MTKAVPRRAGSWRPPGGALVALAAFVFYRATMAPGLLWGDAAKLQRMAFEADLRFDEAGHPLWVMLAHPLTRVPGLDPAGACNLLSAALSALALWPAFRIMRRLGASGTASALSCLALAVSHTYWLHAATAEVYALNSLVALGVLDVLTGRAARPGLPAWGAAAMWGALGLIAAAASGNHLLVALWLPGYLWWMRAAWRAGRLSRRSAAWAASGFVLGLIPFVLMGAGARRPEPFFALMGRLARETALPGSPARDAFQFAGYLLYQFPIPIVLVAAAVGFARLWRNRKDDVIGLLILYLVNALFAVSYRVPDRFAFLLPSYLVIALVAAVGLDALLPRRGRLALPGAALTALVCVLAPPVLYDRAPSIVGPAILRRFPSARELPGRDAVRFHLYPGKSGYDGARRFCIDALSGLPQGSMLLADYSIREPLRYMQVAEGLRHDVEVTYAMPSHQLRYALDAARPPRRVFIAARDALYDVASLSTRFEIRRAGPVYELVPR